MPNWTKEQEQAIYEKGKNTLVAAAAGSGKTAVLVERMIHKIIDEKIDIDKVLSELKEKTNKEEKKVIVFEILGLMYSDGEYDEVERNFIDNLINEFEITNEELNRIEELLNQYSELYKKIVLEIFNK